MSFRSENRGAASTVVFPPPNQSSAFWGGRKVGCMRLFSVKRAIRAFEMENSAARGEIGEGRPSEWAWRRGRVDVGG